jgi:hypothetical protein
MSVGEEMSRQRKKMGKKLSKQMGFGGFLFGGGVVQSSIIK